MSLAFQSQQERNKLDKAMVSARERMASELQLASPFPPRKMLAKFQRDPKDTGSPEAQSTAVGGGVTNSH